MEKCTPSAALNLPVELLYKICSKLPFRSKVQCQSVCKTWNAVLRTPAGQVWGTIPVKLCKWSKAHPDSVSSAASAHESFSPISRFCLHFFAKHACSAHCHLLLQRTAGQNRSTFRTLQSMHAWRKAGRRPGCLQNMQVAVPRRKRLQAAEAAYLDEQVAEFALAWHQFGVY